MADRVDELTNRVGRLKEQTDSMSMAIQTLSADMSQGFREQREYTEDAYLKLDAKIGRLDAKVGSLDTRVGNLEAKVDAGVARLDAKIDDVAARLDAKMDVGFGRIDDRFTHLERTLERFTDAQVQMNQIMDRRLRSLEK